MSEIVSERRSNLTPAVRAPGHLGTLNGVVIPTCENMWGVLIFLRFFYIVGEAGVLQAYVIVIISWLCAILTALSLSVIATNGPIEQGGVYYLISRALGHKIGGAVGCVYFFGMMLLSVLEVLGAIEVLLETEPRADMGLPRELAVRLWALAMLAVLCGLVYGGIRFVSKLGSLFAAIVLLTMLSYYVGLCTAPISGVDDRVTGLSSNTFRDNWSADYDSGVDFSAMLSIFFPCFTGILSGANRATNLRSPEKSIPVGTISAICLSAVVYLSYMTLWGAVASRDYLKGKDASSYETYHRHLLAGGDAGNSVQIVKDIAWPSALATQIGVIIASLSQALQCLVVSPKLLQAIAADGVVPFLQPYAEMTNNEPKMALLFTGFLAACAAMIGSLDLVAPLLSICFLTCYASLNLATFLLSVMRPPSWRPTWVHHHWSTGLLGFFACFTMMFLIKWYYALIGFFLTAMLFLYIDYKEVQVDWGSGLGGLRLHLAVQSILSLGHELHYAVNWRPQLLTFVKYGETDSLEEPGRGRHLLRVAAQLKKGKGLCVVTGVMERPLTEDTGGHIEAVQSRLELDMEDAGIEGFAKVIVMPSYNEGMVIAAQSLGLGSLTPNTLLFDFPHHYKEEGQFQEAVSFVEMIKHCFSLGKALIVPFNLESFPDETTVRPTGPIDIWWIIHDGGLLILLAHLLSQHKIWRNCHLRIHTVAGLQDNSELLRKSLTRMLTLARIDAEVDVVEFDADDLVAYTHDLTQRAEEAAKFAAKFQQLNTNKKLTLKAVTEGTAPRTPRTPTAASPKADEAAGNTDNFQRRKSTLGSATPFDKYEEEISTNAFPQMVDFAQGVRHQSRESHKTDLTRHRSLEDVFRPVSVKLTPAPDDGEHLDELKIEIELPSTRRSSDSVFRPTSIELVDTLKEDPPKVDVNESAIVEVEREDTPDENSGVKDESEDTEVFDLTREWPDHPPDKLNALILNKSKEASLVIINLPDPKTNLDVLQYMQYVESMVDGLHRVLFVHGCGQEVWSL
ncbi:hypothetical protein CYMTET_56789 [Cymbomonas tetramitiformis]|uniref:Uncharacterized protein n=1 Tax=Cymbomonas tetramitiformis TaxID=36881 RepID=A0AAE0ENE9_9CHLO|nr:hypothetical protein CYMTET_56789 [Cymbomonas tetramitiformis]